MKKHLLIVILLALFVNAAHAAVLTGTVLSHNTCAGVAGQKVYIEDSIKTWKDSTITNSNGDYTFTIPASIPAPSALYIETTMCGPNATREHVAYIGSSVHCNLITCGSVFALYGYVYLGTGASAPYVSHCAVIYLIRRDVDPVTFDTSLVAVDSTITYNNSGVVGNTGWVLRFPCQLPTVYFIKAALHPSDPNYGSYLPTYRDSSLNWNGGTKVPLIAYTGYPYFQNVWLKPGVNPGGPAFIGGRVVLGANKNTAVGDPLSKRVVILTTATGQAVASTLSDASGNFQFSNIAYGNYKLFGDAWGKANPALAVTVSASKKTVTNIIFEENNRKFEGHFNTTGINGQASVSGLSVFPNPAVDFTSVHGLAAIPGDKIIVLSNITGGLISRTTVRPGEDVRISMAGLPAGVYMMRVQTELGNGMFRVVK